MIELLSDPQVWIAFLTLTVLELVLGIDNVIFISILVDKLPKERRDLALLSHLLDINWCLSTMKTIASKPT